MKSYTDLEQSKKLEKILPLESADLYYDISFDNDYHINMPTNGYFSNKRFFIQFPETVPCWSLASLLNYLREIEFFPEIEVDEHGVTMSICYYDNEEGEILVPIHDIMVKAESFIDACYEIILKLHEQKIL
jgi:hypothetical protein